MTKLERLSVNPFDGIRRIGPNGDFWSARDLQDLLGYETWRNFEDSIERARVACENSGQDARDHFVAASKMITLGKGGERAVLDYHLSRYACYLIAMNGDSRKSTIANAQTYFAAQTHFAEQVQRDPVKPVVLSPAQQLLEQAHLLVAQDERLSTLERRFDSTPIALVPEQEAVVYALCQELGKVMPGGYRAAYRAFKAHFSSAGIPLAKYASLPTSRFDEACRYLHGLIAQHSGGKVLASRS